MHSLQRHFVCGFSISVGTLVTGILRSADSAAPSPPKTHVLFVGADLAVEREKKFFAVDDVTATSLVIKSEGKPVEISLLKTPTLRVTESLKIAATSAAVGNFKSERAYSPAADPYAKFAAAAGVVATKGEVQDLARGTMLRAQVFGGSDDNAAMGKAQSMLDAGQLEDSRQIYNMDSHTSALPMTGEEPFDAIRVSFEISSEKSLRHPYYALIAQMREPNSKPTEVRRWVYVKSLGPMQPGEKQSVQIYQSGFTPGYLLEGTEVHLFDSGREVPTNLSRKRVPLTADEAFQYAVVEYIGQHKGATLAATIAKDQMDRAPLQKLAHRVTGACWLRVTKQGRVSDAFSDSRGEQKLSDAELAVSLHELRFYPALEKGLPVESLVPLAPNQLTP